jgi:putative transposase
MRKSRFTESQIVAILKEGQAGVALSELNRRHGISRSTYFNWRAKYGGVSVSEPGSSGNQIAAVRARSRLIDACDVPVGCTSLGNVTLEMELRKVRIGLSARRGADGEIREGGGAQISHDHHVAEISSVEVRDRRCPAEVAPHLVALDDLFHFQIDTGRAAQERPRAQDAATWRGERLGSRPRGCDVV